MKTNWGALIVDGRGKLGGHVAQKGPYGSILRTKSIPINPSTDRQQVRRSSISALTRYWAKLTDDDRKTWNDFAASNPVTDIFGKSMRLTGFNVFCQSNINLFKIGRNTNKQTRKERRKWDKIYKGTVTADTNPPALILNSAVAITEVTNVAVYASPPLSQGRASAGSQYKHIINLTEADTFPVDLIVAYEKSFGPITQVDEKIFIKLVQIEVETGLASTPITASAIIIETPTPP